MEERIHFAGAAGAIVVHINLRLLVFHYQEALTQHLHSFISRSMAYISLGKLFYERQRLEIKKEETKDDSEAIIAIDFEEQEAGYQAA